MPKLRGASPVGRDGEGRSYVARAVSRGWPNWRGRNRGKVLNTGFLMTVPASHTGKSRELGWGGRAGRLGVRAGAQPGGRTRATSWTRGGDQMHAQSMIERARRAGSEARAGLMGTGHRPSGLAV